jgi:hypothetical protein
MVHLEQQVLQHLQEPQVLLVLQGLAELVARQHLLVQVDKVELVEQLVHQDLQEHLHLMEQLVQVEVLVQVLFQVQLTMLLSLQMQQQ